MSHQFVSLFFLLSLLLSSCRGNGADETDRNRILIEIDGNRLTLGQFDEYFEGVRISYREGEEGKLGLREARLKFLFDLVEEMIMLRRAEELNLRVSGEEFEEAMKRVEKDYTQEGLKDMFVTRAISRETWEQRLRNKLLVDKALQQELLDHISVSPEEIRAYHDKHPDKRALRDRVRVLHILVDEKKLAEHLREQIVKGEDFQTLARLHSTAPEADRGGDMGYVTRGELPDALGKAVFDLKEGAVSPVVKSPYGYHLFKVTAKEEADPQRRIDEGRIDEIRDLLRQEKLEAVYGPWLADLRSRYKVTVHEELVQ